MDIQAAYKREKAMDEKFDRIMELLEKMMPASKSESEPELCASVEEDSSESEVTDSDWFSVQLHELKQFMRETKSQSSVFNSKSNVLVVESTPEKVESGEVFEDIESDMTAENIILSEVDVIAESGKEDFSLDVDLHSDSEKSAVIDCTDTEVTSDKFSVDGSSAFLWSKDDLGKCDEHDDLNEEIRFEASLDDLISNFSFRMSGVCRNASMNRPTHFTMHMDLSNRLNHILPPKKKIRVLKPPAKPPDDDVLQDVVTWNSFISGLMRCSRCRDAMKVFREMVSLRPSEVTFASVLTGCGRMGLLDTGKMIHGLIVVGEYSADVHLDSSLIDMYGKCREMNNARKGFDRMPERNVVSWSSIISGYAQSDLYKDAIQMFREMENEGFTADPSTISSVASACGSGALDQGRWVHSFGERKGIEMNPIVKNAFIDMYLKCGEVEKALDIFEKMEFRDVFSWTAMVIIDCRGHRVVAQSVLPGILQGDKSGSLLYGFVDNGKKIFWNEDFHAKVLEAAKRLHLKEHMVSDGSGNIFKLAAPVECKGIVGSDDRHYLLDLMRATPRDANYTGQGSKFCILRPELVTSYCQKTKAADKLKPGTGEEVEIQASSESSELSTSQGIEDRPRVPADSGDVLVERTEEETNAVMYCSDAQADIKNLVDEISFNPNAFTEFKLAGTEEINGDEQSGRKISVYLKDVVVPKFIQDLCTLEVSPMGEQTLTEALHAHGINVRYYMKKSAVSPNNWRADMERHPFKHIPKGTAVADPSKFHGAKLLNEEYSFVNDGLLMWFATEKMVKTYFNYYHGPSIVLIDKELQAWYSQAVITSHTVYKDAEWWPFLVSFSNNIFMFSVPRPPEVAEFDHEIILEAKEKVMPFGQAYVTNKVLHLINKCNQATLKCADLQTLRTRFSRRMEE